MSPVRELRHRLKLSQQEFAVKAGVSVRTVSVYETGKTPGSLVILRRFAQIAFQYGFTDLVNRLEPQYSLPAYFDIPGVVNAIDRIAQLNAEMQTELVGLLRLFKIVEHKKAS